MRIRPVTYHTPTRNNEKTEKKKKRRHACVPDERPAWWYR